MVEPVRSNLRSRRAATADQPDAPGTSIATVTAKQAGTAVVTFTLKPVGGGGAAMQTRKLTVKIK